MADEQPQWLDYVMAGTVLASFAGYVIALGWLDIPVTLGLQLALATTGLGAIGGVGLLALARRGTAAERRRLLFSGVQMSVIVTPVLLMAPTVDHAGFRATFFVCGTGIAFFGAALMGAAALNPDLGSSLGDTEAS